MPEHPPPTIRIRSPHSGLPSSSRRSEIFLAAVSVNVIIQYLLGWSAELSNRAHYSRRTEGLPGALPTRLQDAAGGQQRDLLEARVRAQSRHQQRRLGHLVGPEH